MDSMQNSQDVNSNEETRDDNQAVENELPELSDQQIKIYQLEKQFKGGANWFYWIAGLSLINSVLFLTGKEWSFIVGLGATQLIDSFFLMMLEETDVAEWVKYIAFVMDLMVAGLYVLFGFLANKGFKAGFITGMIFYALDGLIFLLAGDFLSIGFHVFALFCIFGGLKALNQLKNNELTSQVLPSV